MLEILVSLKKKSDIFFITFAEYKNRSKLFDFHYELSFHQKIQIIQLKQVKKIWETITHLTTQKYFS